MSFFTKPLFQNVLQNVQIDLKNALQNLNAISDPQPRPQILKSRDKFQFLWRHGARHHIKIELIKIYESREVLKFKKVVILKRAIGKSEFKSKIKSTNYFQYYLYL